MAGGAIPSRLIFHCEHLVDQGAQNRRFGAADQEPIGMCTGERRSSQRSRPLLAAGDTLPLVDAPTSPILHYGSGL